MDSPKSQKEMNTEVRPETSDFRRARYRAHDDAGEPGSGSSKPDDDGDRDMAAGGAAKLLSREDMATKVKMEKGQMGEIGEAGARSGGSR